MATIKRNNALYFARFTRENLRLIENTFANSSDFHPVTQLINSLVGLLVFVHEKKLLAPVADLPIVELAKDGWPVVRILKDEQKIKTSTLEHLIRHLRNSLAHGLMTFSSDTHDLNQVTITVEDRPNDKVGPDWVASLTGFQLRDLCLRLIQLVEDPRAGIESFTKEGKTLTTPDSNHIEEWAQPVSPLGSK